MIPRRNSVFFSNGKNLLLLIGADNPVSQSELLAISNDYKAGTLSMLIAEGNRTNEALINTALQVSVSGSAIVDPSSPFQDQRVLPVTLGLGTQTRGILDIASPIDLGSSTMTAVARTSPRRMTHKTPPVAQNCNRGRNFCRWRQGTSPHGFCPVLELPVREHEPTGG